jgi:hypothetical protein
MTFRNKNNNIKYNINKNKTFRNSNHVNSLQIGGNKKGGSDTKTMDNNNTVYKQFKKYENDKDKHILIKISEILHPYETLSTSTSTSDTTSDTTSTTNIKLGYTCKSISI